MSVAAPPLAGVRAGHRVARLVGWCCLLGTVGLLSIIAAGELSGRYHPLVVLSGSMRPAFAPGDVVIVSPTPTASLRVGDILTYHVPIGDRHVESHRIVWIRWTRAATLVRTKGDANTAVDPWTARITAPTAQTVSMVVPRAGRLVAFVDRGSSRVGVALVALVALSTLALRRIWRRQPRSD